MRIAIVGANGHVGLELCFLFERADHEVIPIVRNELGAAFLRRHGFAPRVADVNDSEDVTRALKGADIIVLAANATDVGGSSRKSLNINQKMIENAIRFGEGTVVYFSSIRAFSRKVDPTCGRIITPAYDAEKRKLEKVFLRTLSKYHKNGVVFRLGHVFGPFQPRTKGIRTFCSTHNPIEVQGNGDTPSNVIHTVTIVEAILRAPTLSKGVYSLVNQPNWTWNEVFTHYAPARTTIRFSPPSAAPAKSFGWGKLLAILKPYLRSLGMVRLWVPTWLDQRIQHHYHLYRTRSDIQEIRSRQRDRGTELFVSPMLTYNPIPGPFVSGLSPTTQRLKDELPEELFE
ncbi:MAG: NAD(P)-dependent oxidoreductase [archaeon]